MRLSPSSRNYAASPRKYDAGQSSRIVPKKSAREDESSPRLARRDRALDQLADEEVPSCLDCLWLTLG